MKKTSMRRLDVCKSNSLGWCGGQRSHSEISIFTNGGTNFP